MRPFRNPFSRRSPEPLASVNGSAGHLDPVRPPERVMVFPRDLLDSALRFEGFRTDAQEMAGRFLSAPLTFVLRSPLLEADETWKQVVACVVPWHMATRRVWCFRRGSTEGRLEGLLSCLVGGHVSEADRPSESLPDPLEAIWRGAIREMGEEMEDWQQNFRSNQTDIRLRLIGVVNDESNPVCRVHFGFCYLLESKPDILLGFAKDCGSAVGWTDVDKLVMDADVEPWSRHVARHLVEKFSFSRS